MAPKPNPNQHLLQNILQQGSKPPPPPAPPALRGLGSISIRLVRYNIRQCLNDCFELYSDAIPSIKQAMRNYNEKRFDDANVQISSVMDAATTCEDGFKERRGVVSPLTKRNGDVFELSAMALSVMRISVWFKLDR